jgi:ATP:ADP antiporter, AAA family
MLELRSGEGRAFGLAFMLFALTIGGHTLVETARDTLFLSLLPPERLVFVYVAVALGTLLVTPLCARLVKWMGAQNALVWTLLASAFGVAWFRLQPPSVPSVFGLYVFASLTVTVLVAEFWIMASSLFTAGQGRRLFGPLAAGGVLGAMLGASLSTLLLRQHGVEQLLVYGSLAFVLGAVVATFFEPEEEASGADVPWTAPLLVKTGSLRQEPFVWKLALIVALSTALSVVVDYVFKARAVSSLDDAELGTFFARYHLIANGASLLLQVFLTGPLVARLGVLGVSLFTPSLLALGAVVATFSGAALSTSVALRGLDAALRNSVHRVGIELLWAPIERRQKAEAKALVEGTVVRGAQAATALFLLALTTAGHATLPALTFIAAVLAALWLGASLRVQRPYLELFRKALGRGDLGPAELDLTAIQALLEALARPDPDDVIAAMNLLAERGRSRLIPALILYHHDERVLQRALELLSDNERRDWLALGERLLEHSSEAVRSAAVRALGLAHAHGALERAAQHTDPQVRTRAALHLTQLGGRDIRTDARVQRALAAEGPEGLTLRLALIEAIAVHPTPEGPALLLELAKDPALTSAVTAALAVSADLSALEFLIGRLATRSDREHAQRGLVRLGAPAFEELSARLDDPGTPRRVLLHIPLTLAAFRSPDAVRVLLATLRSAVHPGFVRYKALRGLQMLATETRLSIDLKPILAEIERNATEHLRLFALVLPLRQDPAARERTSLSLVVGLIEDKLQQAEQRIERLVQIAQRSDDVSRVFMALRSPDRYERASATEYLDALARRWDGGRDSTAQLLGLVVGEATDVERARAAEPFAGPAPQTTAEALGRLLESTDPLLQSFARHAADALPRVSATVPAPAPGLFVKANAT